MLAHAAACLSAVAECGCKMCMLIRSSIAAMHVWLSGILTDCTNVRNVSAVAPLSVLAVAHASMRTSTGKQVVTDDPGVC